jgi:hypothetical protein
MPRVLNLRDLPGYAHRGPVIPAGAVYIGRPAWRYGLSGSLWANVPLPSNATDSQRAHAVMEYETRLTCDAVRMGRLHELRGRDLVCWCSPKACHGDVLLEFANINSLADAAF